MKRTGSMNAFDCIEMKRRGSDRVYETVKDMTPEEEMAYWKRANEELEKIRQANARKTPTRPSRKNQ